MIAKHIIGSLLLQFRQQQPLLQTIETALRNLPIDTICIDHFACIDLPGPRTGIPVMQEIFTAIDFEVAGQDYLAAKQNDFTWMRAAINTEAKAELALPQVVIADFRLDAMPGNVSNIITKYSNLASKFDLERFKNAIAANKIQSAVEQCKNYFIGRDWPLPTIAEYLTVKAFNELLAWVLIFGRRPNHFTFAIHLMKHFNSLSVFNEYIMDELRIPLNTEGGLIKGNSDGGIMQSSTANDLIDITLTDGKIKIANSFLEFVWRFAKKSSPTHWSDYYPHFIAQQADHVIKSLYTVEHP